MTITRTVTVLDLSDLLKVELRNDNAQSIDTKWDETIIVLRKQPDDEVLESLWFKQLAQADQLKQLLALYIPDTVQKTITPELCLLKENINSILVGGERLGVRRLTLLRRRPAASSVGCMPQASYVRSVHRPLQGEPVRGPMYWVLGGYLLSHHFVSNAVSCSTPCTWRSGLSSLCSSRPC